MNQKPILRVSTQPDPLFHNFFSFEFSLTAQNSIALDPLTDTASELWQSAMPVTLATISENASLVSSGNFTFIKVQLPKIDDTQRCTYEAYKIIFQELSKHKQENLARIWNFIPHILKPENQYESTYHAFNAGRQAAWFKFGPKLNGLPKTCSATGMGVNDDTLTIIALLTKLPVTSVENPRQLKTRDYPRMYGPMPPLFARASIVKLTDSDRLLFLSGTGSIIGSDTKHIGSPKDQLEETIKNIEAIISNENLLSYGQAGFKLSNLEAIRVYSVSKQHLPLIKGAVKAAFGPQTKALILHSQLCRPDLELEIEAVIRG